MNMKHNPANLSLNEAQKDILTEIGNIGAGHAACSLSHLLNKTISMNVPNVHFAPFEEIMELSGGAERIVASVFLRFSGDVNGNMFFVLPVDQATRFVRALVAEDFSFANPPYPEIALSAYQEIGNILAGSYLSALSDFLNIRIAPSVPEVAIDMFGAIISFGLLEISRVADYAIAIDAEIKDHEANDQNESIKGHFFLLPDPESLQYIFSLLGEQLL